jgi:mcrBC restriction endonuclease system mcrB subunit
MLKKIFRDRILPLLQEYFYEDYNKIRLVFGNNGFVTEENIIPTEYFKDSVPDGMIQEKKYTINDSAFDKIENYKKIII